MERLTVSQAADILHVHPETLRRYEKNGYIISKRTKGGHRRYDQIEVESLKDKLTAGEISSTPMEFVEQNNFSQTWLENKMNEIEEYKPAPPSPAVIKPSKKPFHKRFSGLCQFITGISAFLLFLGIIFLLSNQGSEAQQISIFMTVLSIGFLFCLPLLVPVLIWGAVILSIPFLAVWYKGVAISDALVGAGSYIGVIVIFLLAAAIISWLDDCSYH